MRNDRRNIIVEKTIDFSVLVLRFSEQLRRRNFFIANQLVRSGTSIGANVFEAQNAESLNDFIHKMKIAAKEASETRYWLMLCGSMDTEGEEKTLIVKLVEIVKLLSRIISTAKQKSKQSNRT